MCHCSLVCGDTGVCGDPAVSQPIVGQTHCEPPCIPASSQWIHLRGTLTCWNAWSHGESETCVEFAPFKPWLMPGRGEGIARFPCWTMRQPRFLERIKIITCSDAAKSSGVIAKRVDLCVPLERKTNTPLRTTKSQTKQHKTWCLHEHMQSSWLGLQLPGQVQRVRLYKSFIVWVGVKQGCRCRTSTL